jgi:hypothetical protein
VVQLQNHYHRQLFGKKKMMMMKLLEPTKWLLPPQPLDRLCFQRLDECVVVLTMKKKLIKFKKKKKKKLTENTT